MMFVIIGETHNTYNVFHLFSQCFIEKISSPKKKNFKLRLARQLKVDVVIRE
jgi:hypothetical protein